MNVKLFSILFYLFLVSCTIINPSINDVRSPNVAGRFYAADKKVLEEYIDNLLARNKNNRGKILSHIGALIVPHAAYEYSGNIAALAYEQIKGRNYKNVIILSGTHYVPFDGIYLSPHKYWSTPLGKIEVNQHMTDFLQKKLNFAKIDFYPFLNDHTIEVQIPFLQKTLEKPKILPIMIGNLTKNELDSLSELIIQLVNKDKEHTLVIVSTDFSHYHNAYKTNLMDSNALEDIKKLDRDSLEEDLKNKNCEMCGSFATIVLVDVAKRMGWKVKVLGYSDSSSYTNDKSSVVGYASLAFYVDEKRLWLNDKEKNKLLSYARKVLNEYTAYKTVPAFQNDDKKLYEKSGVFVTLTKDGVLRGCMGYVYPQYPLVQAISDMTVAAAAYDRRFNKVTIEETDNLKIEISVLGELIEINDIAEIEIGRHGLYLVKDGRSAVFLPQVIVEENWDRKEALRQLSIKAGLNPSAWEEKDSKIYIFSAQVFSE